MNVPYVKHNDLLIHPQFVDAFHDAGLDGLDRLLSIAGDVTLDKRGLPPWRERIVLTAGPHTLYLKRYRQPPRGEQLHQRISGFSSTAAVEWYWLRRVQALGIAGPTPVAFGQLTRLGRENASAIITAQVPGVSLERWIAGPEATHLRQWRFRTRLIGEVAQLTRTIHRAGLFHRDFYIAHLFISHDAAQADTIRLALIDLQRMILPRFGRKHWLIKDLASLNYSTPAGIITRSDRLRFLHHYFDVKRLSDRHRRIIRLILRKTARITRHSRKHGLG